MDRGIYLQTVTKKVVADFVRNNIICKFKIPESTKSSKSSTTIPQLTDHNNGAVEEANKNIKRILRKIVEDHWQWHDKLPFALLGYLASMKTSTREMPYMLVYGTKAVIPTKVEIPSLRVIQEEKLDDTDWIQVRQEQLVLINKKRMDAVCHGQLY
ncbi:PREDICTED: uncharacterized protein LOC109208883 [Nicotiana attenuata]|uniref:uncharacterized protein LOC109208883 n=1 Tax=Nicotiana attenuata TaxID=49451 RepID=UPI000905D6DD|nr:PREDICTED: uncharacterized protein LOC109208883 [Nicotiana attenuata]